MAGLSLYPNPAKDRLTIDVSNLQEITDLQIMDVTGKVVWKQTYLLSNNNDYIGVSTKEFSRGIYFLNAASKNLTISRKIILN